MGNKESNPQSTSPDLTFRNKVVKKGFGMGASAGLTLLPYAPKRLFPFIVDKTLRPFADTPQKRMTVDWLYEYVSPGHPGAENFKRIFKSIHPNVRKKYLTGFAKDLLFRDPSLTAQIEETREEIGAAPKLAVISPTARCNLKCEGCYAGNFEQKSGLTQEEVQSVIDQSKEMGVRFFVISGGEPLMYKPLFSILENNPDSVFQLYTNGTLIDKEMAKKIVEVGNACPCISIEGFEQETDGRRGRGVFNKVMEAFDNLHKAGAMYGFSATGTRKNYKNITSKEFINLMVEKGVHYGWYFMFMPVGKDIEAMDQLFLTVDERSEFRERINRIRKTQPMLVGDFWNDGGLTKGCLAAGRHYFHVDSEGYVEPCVFTHFATDNIRRVSLKDALSSPFFKHIRNFTEYDYSCNNNMLRPCCIVDRPYILRDAVVEEGAEPTHEGADTVVNELADRLDQYAEDMEKKTGPIWKRDYNWTKTWNCEDKIDSTKSSI